MTLGNANYDAILSTTLANYRKTLEDQVFTARPLVAWLKRKDRIKMKDGGAKIVQPLMYAQNQAAGSYSGYDTLPLTASGGISAAEYPWKQFAATIAINGLEEAENSGEEAIIDLLESKITQAEETIAEAMDVMFLADGSGNSGKDWWGLTALVNSYDVTQNASAPGNISLGITATPVVGAQATQNQWWSSFVDYGTGGVVTTKTVAVNGVNQVVPSNYAPASQAATPLTTVDMAHDYNLASKGSDAPDFGLAGQLFYEKYESLLTPNMRFEDTKTADGGFGNLLFKTMPICFDVNIANDAPGGTATSRLYLLNSKYINLFAHKNRWFTNTPFKTAPNQDARYAQILCYGNLAISNRMRHALMLNRY